MWGLLEPARLGGANVNHYHYWVKINHILNKKAKATFDKYLKHSFKCTFYKGSWKCVWVAWYSQSKVLSVLSHAENQHNKEGPMVHETNGIRHPSTVVIVAPAQHTAMATLS
eukprot:947330-Amphidinium_carterae.1